MTAPAVALTPAELVSPQLEATPISLASIHEGTITYFDQTRSLRDERVDRFVQVRRLEAQVRRDPALAMLVLNDGQRIAGSWLGAGEDGQAVRWEHPSLGAFVLPLDRVRRIEWAGPVQNNSEAATADVVALRNGDALRGFVSEVSDDSVTITPDGARGPVTAAIDTVAAITLANPTLPTDPTQHRVLLDDGTYLAALELEVAGDTLRLLPALGRGAEPIDLPIDRLARIDFTGAGYELIELTTLPMRTVEAGEVFGLTFEPRIEGGRLHAHAPSQVAFDLPDGVRRMAATAELDVDAEVSAERISWASFELVVRIDGEEVGRWPVGAEKQRASVNVPIRRGAGELTLELDPAVNGPIMDRLLLRDATLLRDRPEPRSAVQTD